MSDFKSQLRQFCLENKVNATRMLRTNPNFQHLALYIEQNCPEIIKTYSLKAKIYWILNGLNDFPRCQICGKVMTDDTYSIFHGHHLTCSKPCSRKLAQKTTVKTCLERYGTTNGGGSTQSVEKIKQTCLKRYGSTNIFSSVVGKDKIRKTMKLRYGVEFPGEMKTHREKMVETNLRKFGVEFPLQSEVLKQKSRESCLEKYGVNNVMSVPEIRKKTQHRYVYNSIAFDSAPEIAFYIYLTENNIPFEYQPTVKFEYTFNNKTHFYMPDFKVDGQFVELKGDQFFKDGKMQNPYDHSQDLLYEAKHQCMIKNNVKILRPVDYQKYVDYIIAKYGKTYLKQFKTQ